MPDLDSPDAKLPAFMIARKLRVSRQLVNYWRTSGKLAQAGEGADGRPLYRLLDAAVLEAKMRNDPKSSRKRELSAA